MPIIFFNGKFQEGDIKNIAREPLIPIEIDIPEHFGTVATLPETQYYHMGDIVFETKSNQFYVLGKVIDSTGISFKFWSLVPYVNYIQE